MNAVVGMTECLAHTELTQVQKDYVAILLSSSEELLTLINDILDYSKIESGHLDFEERPFSISTCLEGAIDILTPKASAQGLELVCSQSFEVPDIVIGDSNRVRQIVCNLLSNAVKFTHQGNIVLSVAAYPFRSFNEAHAMAINPNLFPKGNGTLYRYIPAELSASQYHNLYAHYSTDTSNSISDAFYVLHISVADTGIGIPQDRMSRLFRVFSQVDASTTRVFGGTGLGLAICKRLAELMAGTVWVESQIDVGSTFNFTIVVRHEQEVAQSTTAVLRGRSVVILVRNPIVGDLLVRYCTMWNMVATLCSSWNEASAWLYTNDTKCTICLLEADLLGPEETMRPPEAAVLSKPVAVIVIVPLGRGVPTTCNNADAVITKPVKMSRLRTKLQAIATVLDRKLETSHVTPSGTGLLQKKNKRTLRSPEAACDLSTLRILLVDDNVVNQKVGIQLLRRLGLESVDTALNGKEAIEKLTSTPELSHDLVLMDVQMPVMDGLTAAKFIRENLAEPFRSVKIIAVTANAMSGDRESALAVGMDDYISKPIFIGDLRAALLRNSSKL